MIKKFFIRLINWSGQREDFSKSQFRAGQGDQGKIIREHNEQIATGHDGRKNVAERAVPAEGEILGPSEGEPKKV